MKPILIKKIKLILDLKKWGPKKNLEKRREKLEVGPWNVTTVTEIVKNGQKRVIVCTRNIKNIWRNIVHFHVICVKMTFLCLTTEMILVRPLDFEQGPSLSQSEARIRIMQPLGPIRRFWVLNFLPKFSGWTCLGKLSSREKSSLIKNG